MLTGVYHIGYLVDNLEETVSQYLALYGGEVEARARNDETKANIAYLKCGGVRFELIEPDDKAQLGGSKAQVLHHVGFAVDDIDRAMEQLRANGAKFQTERPRMSGAGVRLAYFDGGDRLGAKQHLSQP